MGVERAVTRWYAQRHVILEEIAALEAARLQASEPVEHAASQQRASDSEQRLAKARERLLSLGPCPKPMMG